VKGAIAIATCVLLAGLCAPAPALADGDPASDVLIAENVFYPFTPPVAQSLQDALNAETAAARRAHFPIRVALIASPTDLGAIPSLFAKPQRYANFLDVEISFFGGKQPLIVVMPNGYGVQGLGVAATAAAGRLPAPVGRTSDDLARAATVAVSRLAAAAGHPVPGAPGAGTGEGSGGESGGGAAAVGVGVLALVAVLMSAAVLSFRHRRARAR
jgi:hypothetical protein